MIRVIQKTVLQHSCHIKKDGCRLEDVVSGDLYIGELGKEFKSQTWFYKLPDRCSCRRYVSVAEATELEQSGQAVWVLRFVRDKGEVVLNRDHLWDKIWAPITRERVPRIDLISRADIERAYIGSERKSRHFMWNKATKKFEKVPPPDGTKKSDWEKDLQEEINFENRIRRQYQLYIDGCHDVAMEARARLIVPFRPDPWGEGRPLFTFIKDQRTR